MDGSTPTALVALGVVAVVAVLALGTALVLLRERRSLHRVLEDQRLETDRLRERVTELADRTTGSPASAASGPAAVAYAAAVPTPAEQPRPARSAPGVPDRVVLSAAVGEPLIKAVALGHGVRRALSARNRHRIRFEMRAESRRVRRDRRREMKAAWRRERARGEGAADAGESAA